MRDLAIKYLGPVERRLRGLHGSKTGVDKALNALSYVDWLIKEAGDPGNLVSICPTSPLPKNSWRFERVQCIRAGQRGYDLDHEKLLSSY